MTAFLLHFGAHWRPKQKTLRLEIGQQADNAIEYLTNITEPCTRLEATLIALDKEFGGLLSPLVSRENFYKLSQSSQDVEAFIDKLQELDGECDFLVKAMDEMIRDRLVFGVRSQVTKNRFMAPKKIDLQNCPATVRGFPTRDNPLSGRRVPLQSIIADWRIPCIIRRVKCGMPL